MPSHGPAAAANAAVHHREFADFASPYRTSPFGGAFAYALSPKAERRSHGGSDQPPQGGHIHDEAHRHHARPRIAPAGRAGHRVRDVGVHPAVRGHRQRGWWRRRISRLERLVASRAGIAGVALLTLVCLLAVAGQTPADDGVYRRPIANDPSTLDPALIGDIYGRSVAQQIFDGLVSFDQTLAITPSLAQFWRASRDGLTWTFTLRKGVHFHHGREVTADDVVYSLTRVLDPRLKSGAADFFTNIRSAPDFRRGDVSRLAGRNGRPSRRRTAADVHRAVLRLQHADQAARRPPRPPGRRRRRRPRSDRRRSPPREAHAGPRDRAARDARLQSRAGRARPRPAARSRAARGGRLSGRPRAAEDRDLVQRDQ